MVASYTLIMMALIMLLFLFSRKGLTIGTIGATFIFVTHFSGYPLLHIRSLLDSSYQTVYELNLNEIVIYSFVGFTFLFALLFFLPSRRMLAEDFEIKNTLTIRVMINVYWSLFLFAIAVYIIKNGISFNSDGHYGDRLDENAGNGLLLINMAAFIPAIILSAMKLNNKNELKKVLVPAFVSGLVFFL